jgi:hypothetical protein
MWFPSAPMPTLEEELLTKILEAVPTERRLRGLPEERVRGLSPEERLAGLSEEDAARVRELIERRKGG